MEQASHENSTEFYEDVAALLEQELSTQVHRSDLRFKLLEVYAATHRRDDFIREASLLLRHAEKQGTDAYRSRVIELGQRVAPDNPLFQTESLEHERTPPAREQTSARRFYEAFDADALSQVQTQIQQAHERLRRKPDFWRELRNLVSDQFDSASRLIQASALSKYLGGAQIYVRNDVDRDLDEAATINAVGQALIARQLGCTKLVSAAAGAGHIEAVARIAEMLDFKLILFATDRDQQQQGSRLSRISLDGVEIRYVGDGAAGTRSEGQRCALEAALEDPKDLFYISPVDAGPHPYPVIVQDLLGMTGRELRLDIMALANRLPSALIVSDADSMNAVGYLHAFMSVKGIGLTCVESKAPHRRGRSRLAREHAWLSASGKVRYTSVADEVARFMALNMHIDEVPKLRLSGGEILAETVRQARSMDRSEILIAVLPVAPPLAHLN